jgi:hypothetical protein
VSVPATLVLASAVAIGLLAGFARGGSFARLARLRIAWWPLLAAAIPLRLAAGLFGELAVVAYLIAFAGIVAVALANRVLPGAWLIAAGATLNLVAVAGNGGMPVSAEAIAAVGGTFPRDTLHTVLDGSTRMPFLADVIPLPIVRTAYSVGDVLIAAGGAWLSFAAVTTK